MICWLEMKGVSKMSDLNYTKQYIGGEWVEGTAETTCENLNPYNGELIYRYREASKEDVDKAFDRAKVAQKSWENTTQKEKSDLMDRLYHVLESRKDDLYAILRQECGSVSMKCDAEYYGILDHIRQGMAMPFQMSGKIMQSDLVERTNFIFRKPRGVIGVIAPWNFPFLLAMRSVVPAIATGNAVVLRPSSYTPASAFFIAELFEAAKCPKGLLSVVSGSSREIGDYFVQHPVANLISFTGSTEVGRHIGELCGKMLREVSLELGGNNSLSILPDVKDLRNAAQAAVWGSYCHAGQICMALNRIIVHKDIYDEFVPLVVEEASKIKVGDPIDSEVFIGPLTTMQQVKHVEDTIAQSIEEGAKVELRGKTEGQLIYPWVLSGLTNDMIACKCETFGPVIAIIKANSEEEMIAIANDTEYGLSSAVFSDDRYHGMEFAKQINTGMIFVNDQSINEEAHIIFGGEGASGIGRFNGEWVVNKFTTEQRVGVQDQPRRYF